MKNTNKKQLAPWHKDLQDFANKCTFWIFSVEYPWQHFMVPKNMKDNMTLMADGFAMIRFKVIDGGKTYKLLQYHFPLSPSSTSKKKASDAGLLFRAMQKYVWIQRWNKTISEAQLREYMHWLGLIKCSRLVESINYIKKGLPLPKDLINSIAAEVQIRNKLPMSEENWGIKE